MPGSTTKQGITVPIGGDVANNPMAFTDMLAVTEARLVQQYASRAARSANNPAPDTNATSIVSGETWYERYTGAKWLPVTPIQAFKAADQTVNNSIVLVDDIHLFVPIPAVIANWAVELWLAYSSDSDADLQVTYAADAAFGAFRGGVMGGAEALTSSFAADMNLDGQMSPTDVYDTGGDGSATGNLLNSTYRAGFVSTGVAGTLQVRWAQATADPTNTTVHVGSWLRLTAIS